MKFVKSKMLTIVLFLISTYETSGQFNCGNTLINIRDGSNYRTVLIGKME